MVLFWAVLAGGGEPCSYRDRKWCSSSDVLDFLNASCAVTPNTAASLRAPSRMRLREPALAWAMPRAEVVR
jgi:hypothetical protein